MSLLALRFGTGLVDAASYLGLGHTSYLGLGHVFAANMTGNIVLLGFGLSGANGLPVLAPAGFPGRVSARVGRRSALPSSRRSIRTGAAQRIS